MTSSHRAIRVSAMLMILAAAVLTAPAAAQSDSALRRENDALRARAGELEAELAAAQKMIQDLEKTIARLEAQVDRLSRRSSSSETPKLEPEKVTIDESIPDASPRALLRAMKESYAEQFGDMEIGPVGDRKRDVYVRAVRKWATQVNREHRGPVNWTVLVIDAQPPTTRGVMLNMQAVDPETDVELGDPFPVLVSSRTLIRRLEALEADGSLFKEKLELKGVLTPDVRANANRESEGTFNNPRFIGPFAEFAFGIEGQSLRPADKIKQDESPTTRNAS